MPLRSYRCHNCQHEDDEYQKLHAPPLIECPKCRTPNYAQVPSLPHTSHKEYHTPIEMMSIACDSLEEIRHLKSKCPDVDISEDENDPNYGIPIARNRKQKTDLLKATGYVERN